MCTSQPPLQLSPQPFWRFTHWCHQHRHSAQSFLRWTARSKSDPFANTIMSLLGSSLLACSICTRPADMPVLCRDKVSSALYFKYNTQLGPPYTVLVDTNFINFSIRNKVR